MNKAQRTTLGCIGVPAALVASCAGKMTYDARMYNLPGEVLKSTSQPTQKLTSSMQVAEALDAYVQPRFEILRDKDFGAIRIVYRKHAGVVQLKVDSEREKEQISNVNATKREYAISLFRCAPRPTYFGTPSNTLLLLYFNQQPVAREWDGFPGDFKEVIAQHDLDHDMVEKKAQTMLKKLLAGKEYRTKVDGWSVLMRPVLATKQECLNCHTNAKIGATLGVMVYSVK